MGLIAWKMERLSSIVFLFHILTQLILFISQFNISIRIFRKHMSESVGTTSGTFVCTHLLLQAGLFFAWSSPKATSDFPPWLSKAESEGENNQG